MMTGHDHLLALVTAAEELGYLVLEVSTYRIRMIRVGDELEITLEGRFVSAEFLRSVLRPAGPPR